MGDRAKKITWQPDAPVSGLLLRQWDQRSQRGWREGFWRGSDQNPLAISNAVPEPVVEGFAQHTFESTARVLPLPAEHYPVTGGPRTLLQRRQAKQLLAMTERILEVRASTSGSDITVASFTDSSLDLTEIAGRHGIEIADQVSCAAGWDLLSSSGRRRFWHVHCTLAQARLSPVQQWLSASNPSKVARHPRFKSARDQLDLYVKGTTRPETISNDFGGFGINQQIRIRFSLSRTHFLNDSNFWCVRGSITCNVPVHVPVLWPVCTHKIPFRILLCPWLFIYTYLCICI